MDETRRMLTPGDLDPKAMYCVVSDVQMRESTVVTGSTIQKEDVEPGRVFRHFQQLEPIWEHYVRVHCDGFVLAVWHDPTRPELRISDGPAEPFVPLPALVDPEEPVQPEAAAPQLDEVPWHECALQRAAARLAETLYVQSS